MITLTRLLDFQTADDIVTLPAGTQLQFVSQIDNELVRARYGNTDYSVPITATDLIQKR